MINFSIAQNANFLFLNENVNIHSLFHGVDSASLIDKIDYYMCCYVEIVLG